MKPITMTLKTKFAVGLPALTVLGGILSVLSAPTLAQSGVTSLEEVIVTARRREESIQSVPIAITALSGEILERRAITDVRELNTAVPALRITPSSQGSYALPIFSIRGLDGDNVAQYMAEVPLFNSRATAGSFYDLESVQVLRGPQGTLFGKNSTGGAILFGPRKPDDTVNGFAQVQVGNYNDREVTFAANTPLLENLNMRVAGQSIKRDGLQENELGSDLSSRDSLALRASFVWSLTDAIENYTMLDYREMDEKLPVLILTGVGTCPAQGLACLYDAEGINLPQLVTEQERRGPWKVAIDIPNEIDGDVWGATNVTTVELGSMTLKNIISYRESQAIYDQDIDGTRIKLLDIPHRPEGEVADQFSEELQLQGEAFDGALNWIIGGYYADFSESDETFGNIFQGIRIGFISNNADTSGGTSKALFAQGTYDLSSLAEGLKFTAGVRQTWDERDQVTSRRRGPPDGLSSSCDFQLPADATFDPVACIRNLDAKYEDYNYTFSLDWQMTDNLLTYLATRRGYTAGGFNNTTSDPAFASFDPELFEDVEWGFKADFTLGSMPARANLALFHGKFSDIQVDVVVTTTDTSGATRLNRLIDNAAEATVFGGEIDLTLMPTDALNLTFFYSHTNAEYDDYIHFSGMDLSGTSFEAVPEDTFGFTGIYTQELSGLGTLSTALSYYYRSEIAPDPFNPTPLNTIDSFGVWDARVDWTNVGGSQFDLGLFVKNLTDEEYWLFSFDERTQLLWANALYGEPRIFGLNLTYRWE